MLDVDPLLISMAVCAHHIVDEDDRVAAIARLDRQVRKKKNDLSPPSDLTLTR